MYHYLDVVNTDMKFRQRTVDIGNNRLEESDRLVRRDDRKGIGVARDIRIESSL
jgi:hypothetical protein